MPIELSNWEKNFTNKCKIQKKDAKKTKLKAEAKKDHILNLRIAFLVHNVGGVKLETITQNLNTKFFF